MKIVLISTFVLALAFTKSTVAKVLFSVPPGENYGADDDNGTEVNFRIFNGNQATKGQFPWQAFLYVDGQDFQNGRPVGKSSLTCGASLIGAQHLLTAAHCLKYYNRAANTVFEATKVYVKLGSLTKQLDGTEYVTTSFLAHPQWNLHDVNVINDIGLIHLPQAVTFIQGLIYPISLPTSSESYLGEYATASGYGHTNNQYENQNLNYVQLKVTHNQECEIPNSESQICTSSLDNYGRPVSVCAGDSGGPLVVLRGSKPILIGVTSYRMTEQCEQSTAVFSKVSYYMSFIRKYVPNV